MSVGLHVLFMHHGYLITMSLTFVGYRLYQRYDFHHRGVISYKDFLHRLGVNVALNNQPPPENAQGGQTFMPDSIVC